MAGIGVGANRLIGRDRELATLGSFLDEAVGDGATLLLTGEPGVGKTALLAAAAEMAATDGVRVIRGGGVEYETDVSFAGLHQLVDPLSDDLAVSLGPVVRRSRLRSASAPALHRTASRCSAHRWRCSVRRHRARPLLIVIDDLHWLDRASGAVVGFVGRRLRGSQDRAARCHPARRRRLLRTLRVVGVPRRAARRRPTRWSCWLASSSTCRPVSVGASSTRRKAIPWRCSSSPRWLAAPTTALDGTPP